MLRLTFEHSKIKEKNREEIAHKMWKINEINMSLKLEDM